MAHYLLTSFESQHLILKEGYRLESRNKCTWDFAKIRLWAWEREEEKDRDSCFRKQQLANLRSFWRKQPGVWHEAPIRQVNGQVQELWGSAETFHPWNFLRIKKRQLAIQVLKIIGNQQGRRMWLFLFIFGSLTLPSFEIFYISMGSPTQIWHWYQYISNGNNFQKSSHSSVFSFSHWQFISQPQLSIGK